MYCDILQTRTCLYAQVSEDQGIGIRCGSGHSALADSIVACKPSPFNLYPCLAPALALFPPQPENEHCYSVPGKPDYGRICESGGGDLQLFGHWLLICRSQLLVTGIAWLAQLRANAVRSACMLLGIDPCLRCPMLPLAAAHSRVLNPAATVQVLTSS